MSGRLPRRLRWGVPLVLIAAAIAGWADSAASRAEQDAPEGAAPGRAA